MPNLNWYAKCCCGRLPMEAELCTPSPTVRGARLRRAANYEIRPQLLSASIEPLAFAYEQRRQRDRTKLEQMVVYAQTALCRTRVLMEALGETVEWSQCGTCDNCRGLAVRSEAMAEGAA